MEEVKTHAEKLECIIESEQFLNEIQDMDILLERLLSEVRRITNADAGSIYINEKNILSIKCAQNDTLQKMLEEGQKVPFFFSDKRKINFRLYRFNRQIAEYSRCVRY